MSSSAISPLHLENFSRRPRLVTCPPKDIFRIEKSPKADYLPGLSSAEKKTRFSRISYKDFLLNVAKVDPGVIAFYQTRTNGEWGVGIDAEPALDCWAIGLPGFQGMKLEPGPGARMSYSASGYPPAVHRDSIFPMAMPRLRVACPRIYSGCCPGLFRRRRSHCSKSPTIRLDRETNSTFAFA